MSVRVDVFHNDSLQLLLTSVSLNINLSVNIS